MRKSVAVGVVFLVVAAAVAQEAVVPAASKAPRIGTIDMRRVSDQSLLGKAYAAKLGALDDELEAAQRKKKLQLEAIEKAIRALVDDLEKRGSVLAGNVLDQKRQELVRKNRERDAFVEDGRAELARLQETYERQAQALNTEFQQKLMPEVQAVARARGIDVLLMEGQTVLTLDKAYDISGDVIVKLDAQAKVAEPTKAG